MSPKEKANKRALSKAVVKQLPGFQNWTTKEFNMKGQSKLTDTIEESNSMELTRPGLGEHSFMQTQGQEKKIQTIKVARDHRMTPKPRNAKPYQSRRLGV